MQDWKAKRGWNLYLKMKGQGDCCFMKAYGQWTQSKSQKCNKCSHHNSWNKKWTERNILTLGCHSHLIILKHIVLQEPLDLSRPPFYK